MMTRERAEAVYDILQREAGAPAGSVRDSFVYIHSTEDCPEFRFGGLLGFGGKYRAPRNRVDCYQEDETPERLAVIERTNAALQHYENQGTGNSGTEHSVGDAAKQRAPGAQPNQA